MSLLDQEDNRDYLAELTGPGMKFDRSKYANEAEMYKAIAKGKVHGDTTLAVTLQEKDELREYAEELRRAATTSTKTEELLARLENNQQVTTSTTQQQVTQPSLNPTQLAEIVRQQVLELEQGKIETKNMETVETKLRERFGDNAASILKEKMKSLNLTNDDLKLLAKRSPDAVLNALGVNNAPTRSSDLPRSSMRTDNFSPDVEIRDAVYYEKLRKEKPKEYFSEKTSVLRLKDMDHPDFLKRFNERENARAFS